MHKWPFFYNKITISSHLDYINLEKGLALVWARAAAVLSLIAAVGGARNEQHAAIHDALPSP